MNLIKPYDSGAQVKQRHLYVECDTVQQLRWWRDRLAQCATDYAIGSTKSGYQIYVNAKYDHVVVS